MTNPITDRERLISLEQELDYMLKSLSQAESENARLRAESQRMAAITDQHGKNVISHLFDIIKLGGAVICGLLGIKYGIK